MWSRRFWPRNHHRTRTRNENKLRMCIFKTIARLWKALIRGSSSMSLGWFSSIFIQSKKDWFPERNVKQEQEQPAQDALTARWKRKGFKTFKDFKILYLDDDFLFLQRRQCPKRRWSTQRRQSKCSNLLLLLLPPLPWKANPQLRRAKSTSWSCLPSIMPSSARTRCSELKYFWLNQKCYIIVICQQFADRAGLLSLKHLNTLLLK